MSTLAIKKYGISDVFEARWGLLAPTGQKIAAIIVYCGNIEYYLERAIWKCEGIEPKGIRPTTDSKSITELISKLENFVATSPQHGEQSILKLWCAAARSGFTIRNNIAHGVTGKFDKVLVFARNPRWDGELRNRAFGDFWADDNTLDLVCHSFATLLRIIVSIQAGKALEDIATPLALSAVREARSILGEFSCQNYNPTFEKY